MRNPLSAIYGTVSGTRNRLYDHGVLSARQLRGPVVSIGNIAAGGSGKTPFVIALGEVLKRRGVSFDVLSRGYGRKTKGVALVNPDGSAREFGDEPLLIARKLEVSVVVGEDRYAAGRLAEENFGPRLHLLDDGFQHRGLARDFDIVLVSAGDAVSSLLPRGRLREPLSALARADAVVLTNDATPDGLPIAHQKLWRVQRDIIAPEVDDPCLAFCGIARPAAFFAQLRAAGVNVLATRTFRDHHAYTEADIHGLCREADRAGADGFLTTEKDAVKLDALPAQLPNLAVVSLSLELENAQQELTTILDKVNLRRAV